MSKLLIIKLITMYSLIYGIDPRVAISVAQIESNFNSNAIGITKDLGVFQLNPNSFPQYTKTQLLNPKLNIELGVKYLAKMKKQCKYKANNEWLICYNMGPNSKTIKHPSLFPYMRKITLAMNGV